MFLCGFWTHSFNSCIAGNLLNRITIIKTVDYFLSFITVKTTYMGTYLNVTVFPQIMDNLFNPVKNWETIYASWHILSSFFLDVFCFHFHCHLHYATKIFFLGSGIYLIYSFQFHKWKNVLIALMHISLMIGKGALFFFYVLA